MSRTTSVSAAGLAAVAILLLSGCVESGRTTTPGAAGTGGAGEDAASGCPWEPDDSVTTTARLAWQPSPTGDLVVKDNGVLEACMPNATIEWSQFASGGDVIQAFGANSADLGLVGSSPATRAVSAPLNLDVSVVWIYEVIGEAESLVVRDESITDVAGLAGKKVAVPFGSTAHYSLLQALDGAGLQDGVDVELINLAPDAMAAAWQGSQVDAAWIWNPVLGQLEDSGKRIFSSADTAEAGSPTYDLAMGTNEFIDANPEFMAQWARAQDWAVQMILEDPDRASEAMAIQMGISPDEAGDQLSGYQWLRASEQAGDEWLGKTMGENLAGTAQFLLEQGSIDAVADATVYSGAVDAEPAASVR